MCRYRDCLFELEKDDVLVCGQAARPLNPISQYRARRIPSLHMTGNFWWTKCSYVNGLPRLSSLNTADRMNAEMRSPHRYCGP